MQKTPPPTGMEMAAFIVTAIVKGAITDTIGWLGIVFLVTELANFACYLAGKPPVLQLWHTLLYAWTGGAILFTVKNLFAVRNVLKQWSKVKSVWKAMQVLDNFERTHVKKEST